MKLIIDTNVWISFLLGKRLAVLREVFANPDNHIFVSDILLNEISEVASRPKFKGKIRPDSLDLLFELLKNRCIKINAEQVTIPFL